MNTLTVFKVFVGSAVVTITPPEVTETAVLEPLSSQIGTVNVTQEQTDDGLQELVNAITRKAFPAFGGG